MLLTLDISNTSIKAGVFRGEQDGDRLRAIMKETAAADKARGLPLSMAVRVGKPRSIDNFLYENGKWSTGEVARA